MLKIFYRLGFYLFIILFPGLTYSAQVIKTTKNFVVIDLLGTSMAVGDSFLLINGENKKVALIEIKVVKNDKAFAKLIKGISAGNEKLEFLSKESINSYKKLVSQKPVTPRKAIGNLKLSALLSLSRNTQNIAYTNVLSSGEIKTQGNSVGVSFAADMPINTWFALRGVVGFDPFSASAEDSINCSADASTVESCKTSINYLSAGLYARVNYNLEKIILWSALGLNIKMPISKTSTVLNSSDIKPTSSYGIVFGIDYLYSTKYFIPFYVEFSNFQKTVSVQTQILSIKTGVGWNY